MKNFCYSDVESDGDSSCCSLSQMLDARRVCETLGMEHYLLDATREFGERVMQRFVDEYEAGRTPNPCVDCNQSVRFPLLLQRAHELGADCVATGHYARIGFDPEGRPFVRRGTDAAKDQSYFLHAVPAACLQRTLFPLGGIAKQEVREVARQAGLPVAAKGESQEICFLPRGERREFLQEHGSPRRGDVVNLQGQRLAEHDGIGQFTVGQRRGLQVAVGQPLYVHHIEPRTHTVVVGDEDSLWSGGVEVDGFWSRGALDVARLGVQLRYRSEPAALQDLQVQDERARLRFATPQRAVAPGQAAVLYDGDTVVGGGRILASLP
jgi:tRNA-specific 2-thiouridylase